MDAAWRVLKQRQTKLGEWSADFPSPHGPVNMVRWVPKSALPSVMREGLHPREASKGSHYANERTPEMFDLSEPGIWVHPATGKRHPWVDAWHDPKTGLPINAESGDEPHIPIGIRLDPAKTAGQYRDEGQTSLATFEPAEGYLAESIDPGKMVFDDMMPKLGEGQPTKGWYDDYYKEGMRDSGIYSRTWDEMGWGE